MELKENGCVKLFFKRGEHAQIKDINIADSDGKLLVRLQSHGRIPLTNTVNLLKDNLNLTADFTNDQPDIPIFLDQKIIGFNDSRFSKDFLLKLSEDYTKNLPNYLISSKEDLDFFLNPLFIYLNVFEKFGLEYECLQAIMECSESQIEFIKENPDALSYVRNIYWHTQSQRQSESNSLFRPKPPLFFGGESIRRVIGALPNNLAVWQQVSELNEKNAALSEMLYGYREKDKERIFAANDDGIKEIDELKENVILACLELINHDQINIPDSLIDLHLTMLNTIKKKYPGELTPEIYRFFFPFDEAEGPFFACKTSLKLYIDYLNQYPGELTPKKIGSAYYATFSEHNFQANFLHAVIEKLYGKYSAYEILNWLIKIYLHEDELIFTDQIINIVNNFDDHKDLPFEWSIGITDKTC